MERAAFENVLEYASVCCGRAVSAFFLTSAVLGADANLDAISAVVEFIVVPI